jgi:hypothetical protein
MEELREIILAKDTEIENVKQYLETFEEENKKMQN